MAGCCGKCYPEPQRSVPKACLIENEIIISGITGIPSGVTFDRVSANIQGANWSIIRTAEAPYEDGEAILPLLESFSPEELMRAIRTDAGDYKAFWRADSDTQGAMVAGVADIIAYDGDTKVGRIYLSDWEGSGSSLHKSFIYYHYADRPFTLSGTYGSYTFEASFKMGWNAYVNFNRSEESGPGAVLCTTTVSETLPLEWRFESWVH